MVEPREHGPLLSDDEYERRVHLLYAGLSPLPSRQQERELRRRELDLRIDNRLGCDFPVDRREALWQAQECIERRRLRLGLQALLRSTWSAVFQRSAQGLARSVAREYRKVLTEEELERFLAPDEPRDAALPPPLRGPLSD